MSKKKAKTTDQCIQCGIPLKPLKSEDLHIRRLCGACRYPLLKARLGAGMIDTVLVVGLFWVIKTSASCSLWLALILPLSYMLIKDGLFSGRSIGKLFTSLVVVHKKTYIPIGIGKSIERNMSFLCVLPLLVSAWQIIMGHIYRVGDGLAETRVVIKHPGIVSSVKD